MLPDDKKMTRAEIRALGVFGWSKIDDATAIRDFGSGVSATIWTDGGYRVTVPAPSIATGATGFANPTPRGPRGIKLAAIVATRHAREALRVLYV